MDTTTINIVKLIGDVYGVEAEDGQQVYDLIVKAFKKDLQVVLSFQNVELLTTAFLNSAVGQLYGHFSEEEIREKLRVEHLSESGKVALKRVVDTAKMFYKDPEALERSIDSVLDD